MNTIRVSATKARNTFFELLNLVAAGGTVVVEKDRKVVAKLVSTEKRGKNKGLLKTLKSAAKGFHYSAKNNPLRKLGAANFLGKWNRA